MTLGDADGKFGLRDPDGNELVSTADDRICDLNGAVRSIGAGTIAFDKTEAAKAGGTRSRLTDLSAGTNLKSLDYSTVAGVSYVAVKNDDGTTARVPITIDHATGSVTILAGKLIADAETEHIVGGSGEPAFIGSWTANKTVRFYKDAQSRVYLSGAVQGGSGNIFLLPSGYQNVTLRRFPTVDSTGAHASIQVSGGMVSLLAGSGIIHLDGIDFHAGY